MNLSRRAQVTVFVILGVVVILAAGILMYAQRAPPTELEAREQVPPIARNTYDAVQDCYRTLAEDYITILGNEGGYLLIQMSPDEVRFPIRDWMVDGTPNIPDVEELEGDLSRLLTRTIPYCVGEYDIPGLESLEATGEPTATAIFRDNDVAITINHPIRATIGGAKTTFEDHVFTIPVRLRHVLSIASAITYTAAANPDVFSEDWLAGYDVDVNVAPAPRYWTYVITDDQSKLKGRPFQLTFIHHYGENR